ncbi:uncharacterized protein I206_105732 [Kwoniella pini CBS 10737]|uniref:Luciferase-like domain-containing protein n=1 Tax=Kwoniella pini CBS 10737 TaxID=1296096 RepID=A0A1B9I3D7_9TREE|nr:uncharacterized protein I206_03365 [Kwoniella pini CBS 10737]OCF50049.1 hypothetical protein I206_03365 [Kwoniella pini CBS 10737]
MTVINSEDIPVASGGRSIQYVGASQAASGDLPYIKRDGSLPRRWILNALTSNTPGMVITGAWRRPGDRAAEYNTIKYWTDLAQLLERGKFSAVFLADLLGGKDTFGGEIGPALQVAGQSICSDPTLWISAAAAVTSNLTFGITQSLTYEKPFTVARRFATLDHLTNGRIAINLVTSALDSAAHNHGLTEQIDHDNRYERADEYLDVLYKLWESSWAEDAVVLDKEKEIYVNPTRVRKINHSGEYYSVVGPAIVEPSIQRTPVLYQAGSSPAGVAFGAKHGEALFTNMPSIEKARAKVEEYRTSAVERGRDAYSVKVVLGVTIYVGSTDEDAQAKFDDFKQYTSKLGAEVLFSNRVDQDLSVYSEEDDLREVGTAAVKGILKNLQITYPDHHDWTRAGLADLLGVRGLPYPPIVGSPTTVADHLQRIVAESDIDGFNIAWSRFPDSYSDIVEYLVPELQKRGVHWLDYPKGSVDTGLTARESLTGVGNRHLPQDHYGSRFSWKAGQNAPPLEAEIRVGQHDTTASNGHKRARVD